MKKLALLVVAFLLVGAPRAVHGQVLLELNGEGSYSRVDVTDWLGDGVFDPKRIGYGGSAVVLLGTRGAGGVHYGLELGYARLMHFNFIFQGDSFQRGIDALRIQALVRFWFDEGDWFGEAAAGVVNLDGSSGSGTVTDPTLGAGIGKPWELSDQLSLVTRANGNLLFDSESMVLTFRFIARLSYTLGS